VKKLFNIHKLALHPLKVGSILLGLALSFAGVLFAGRLAALPSSGGHPLAYPWLVTEALVRAGRFDLLALVFAWLCLVWATLGGAATRRMSLDLLGGAGESFAASFAYCCKWPLAVPSALASLCFFYILLARLCPWLLLLLLPTWLYAGLLYGALTLENVSLGNAIRKVHGRLGDWPRALRLQMEYLVSFSLSTGTVYLLSLAWAVAVLFTCGHLRADSLANGLSALEWILIAPVLAYALGYTTSNLKSLQIYLYLNIYDSASLEMPRSCP
jgi:hypothetical protein